MFLYHSLMTYLFFHHQTSFLIDFFYSLSFNDRNEVINKETMSSCLVVIPSNKFYDKEIDHILRSDKMNTFLKTIVNAVPTPIKMFLNNVS